MEAVVFWIFALLALLSALVVVAHRNPVYSVMSLVVTLFSLAVLFVLLGAPLLAALQILIYAGAILVLFLFVIMLLNVARDEQPLGGRAGQRWGASLGAGLFLGMLGVLLWGAYAGALPGTLGPEYVSVRALARFLFSEYLLPFEIVGLLLLVAVVAATLLARRPTDDAQEGPK